jgi:hypothetical protein
MFLSTNVYAYCGLNGLAEDPVVTYPSVVEAA